MSQVEAEQGTGPTGHDNPLRLLHLYLHPRLGKPSQTQTITRQQLPTRGRAASMFDGPPPSHVRFLTHLFLAGLQFLCIFPWIGSEIAWTSILIAMGVSGACAAGAPSPLVELGPHVVAANFSGSDTDGIAPSGGLLLWFVVVWLVVCVFVFWGWDGG